MSRRALIEIVLLCTIPVCKVGADTPRTGLEILNAIASQSEDGPPASPDFQFLPGDTVYFSFQLAHFGIKRNEDLDTSEIDLSYSASFEDKANVPLANAVSGRIAVQLNSEDKNWLPKRRASFQVPGLVPAGAYEIRLVVKDALAHTEQSTTVPIRVGGESIEPSSELTVQQFRFLRDENGTEPLEIPAYRPGDTVFTRFDIAGFALAKGNQYHVEYGLLVLGPDGKPFVQGVNAATLQDGTFYPAQFVTAALQILTKPASMRGAYTLILKVHDLVGNKFCQAKRVFSLE
jgi:hypothetical protein